ncbi:MAG: LPS export ABC transporter periplasmic protein LptC [Rhodospirillaceae bacterium]|nr:LPS export ABC transporter periplasmic protein LptC [Rhodospirillaceae bacterium]
MSIPHTTPEPDKVWQPRTGAVADDVARYSKFVGYMRVGLPAVAGFLVLLVLVLPQFMGNDERFRVGTSAAVKEAAVEALSMVNARYFGTDKKGQPFSVTAEGVKQHTDDDNKVELSGPQADMTLTNGDWLSVEAKAGLYDRDKETLNLTGDVSLFQDKGYEMHTDELNVQLKDGNAQSRKPVQSQGPFGQLNAQGFDLYDKGDRVVFLGPAQLTLVNGAQSPFKPDEKAPEAKTRAPKTETQKTPPPKSSAPKKQP